MLDMQPLGLGVIDINKIDVVPETYDGVELSRGQLDFADALGKMRDNRGLHLEMAVDAADIVHAFDDVARQQMRNPLERLTDVCLYHEDAAAAERCKGDSLVSDVARGDIAGQNMLIGTELAEMMAGGDAYTAAEQLIGRLPREQQQGWIDRLNHCHTKSDGQQLVGELFRNGVVEQYRTNKAKQEALEEERGMAFNGVFSELVKDANNEEAWNRFREGQARGAFTDADKKALDSAAKAWGMMEILMSDYTRSGAAVLTDAESGERIFNELHGDEMAQAVFLNVLQNEVQDLKNDASRRNALVRFGRAFAASTNNLMAGVIGGKFKAFVTDEQVDAYNREWERARELSGRENPNVAVYAEGDNWVEKYLLPGNARIDGIRKAAQESGQMNQDGSLRKMTAEERKGTQELGAFRGQLFNAVQGMYDVSGVAAKLGKMMPDSMIYLVPGGMFASAGSMHTQELARRSGEGEDYVSANTKAAVEAGISAAVEKLAFGSLKPARMAPGLDWLMSRKVVGQALGKIYGSTAGRIGLGVVAGSAEETFAEPLAGLIMRGVYNVAAADELQLADPLGAYRKEMEEMLAPDQILVTGLYGLLLGGVSAGGHMQAAEDYREMYEHLVSIGVDEGRAAQAARDDAGVAGFKATKALFDETVKKDTKGVIAYLAELYPQIEPLNVAENLFSTWQLPHLIPAENGQVKVQEKDEEGKVTETLMSKEAADLLVQARLEQMKSSEIAKFANQLLGVAMAGKASSETDRFIVEEVDGAMDADYFTRLANAAGVRLQQGSRADEVAPEIHQHLTLGQLVQQGQAWEQRMEIQRNEVDRERAEKNLPPLTDEEWAERKKAYVAAVNRQSVRGADGRKRTLLRVSRGHYGAMNVLEDLTEDFIARDMAANNRGLEWYVQNIRELETALGRQNEFLRELSEGKKPVNQMDIIEAVGKIAQSKLLADTVKGEHGFSAALKSFLEMIRTLILKAAAMLKLGKAINQALTDEKVRGKMDTEFLQLVDDVVAQDIEFLRELQLEDGLAARQRVLEARQEAKADTRVKRSRKAKTPVLDEAERNHGKEVRAAARKKAEVQAKVDADVAAADAALEGEMDGSMSVHIPADRVCHNRKEARLLVGRKGAPIKLENKFLEIEAVFNAKSDGKFNDRESIGRTFKALADTGLSEEEIKSAHYTAFGNVAELFANAERMKFERAYKKQNERKGFLQIFSPFEVEGWKDSFMARIELELHQEKGHLPTAYLLNVSIEKQPLFLGRRGAGAELFDRTEADHIRADFPEVVKRESAEQDRKPGAADASMSVTDAQERGLFKDGVLEASNAVVTAPSFSIEAMHASPHRFRKFDTSKMGTGEGAQAFGWGLYFSGDKGSNREYYRYFADEDYQMRLFRGDNELGEKELQKLVREVFMRHGGQELVDEMEEAIVYSVLREGAQKQLADYETFLKDGGEDIPGLMTALQELAGMGLERKSINLPAINYRVELNADDSNLLMWDEKVPAELHEAVRELKSGQPARGLVMQMPEASKECWEGYRIYSELTNALGSAKAASEWLAERGYKGIKYLDGVSRRNGEGTYNYVIFSGDDVKVTGVNETGQYDAPWEDYEDVDASFSTNMAVVTPEMDARYMSAVKRGDMDAAQRIVNDVARMRGYMADSDYQGSESFNGTAPSANAYFDTDEERYEAWENGEFEGTVSLADFVRRGMEPGNLEWLITSPGAYQRADEYQRESIEAIRKAKSSKRGKVTIYRAVPADVKEGSVRNGDWVTFSKKYAEYHISLQDWEKGRIIKQVVPIDDVWWDGNDVNEWGYDDGKEYAYRNTANNRKLLDAVTYDKNGDIVPLSKRFDYRSGDVSFSTVYVPLYHEILDTFEQRIAKDGRPVWVSRVSGEDSMVICAYPEVLNMITPWNRDVIASRDVVKKLMNKHGLLPQDVAKLPFALWNPVAVFEDPKADKGFIVITDILAPNFSPKRKTKKKDKEQQVRQMKQVMAVLELRTDVNNAVITEVVSAYSADSTEKYKALIEGGYLRYADTERALMWASTEGDSVLQLLTTALLHSGSGVILKADLQNVNTDFSSSLVSLDEESVAREVVDAGQGFRANLAYSEAIMREMRGAMQRLRKLGSKTRTDREDAVAAMGTMVQMVKAAVAVLPKGYRFSVHPYLNRIEALAELAATGDIDLTSDIASKDILQLENAEGVDLKKPFDEMVKEYGNVKLAEALERIMHRVSEQLRKHAKDRAVEKITELVERLAPKKDPKTGKLKGGKMSADAYRDLATVAEAMGMNSEQLEAKLAALRADMAKPGISEELREQLEDEMTLYDQFGDLAGMTAEEAVAAYEALRVRIYFHRFEWDDKQARIRGARRAVVRRVVDGVGSVSENEYNAKKRRVKPSKRLKNLGDILSGMPAALAGMRGYLPLRQMADELALRANAAGEAIKAWEAERWLALEALSKETMGKSWRECMDFMHKVQRSGVSFDRPKFRTVNVKTEELRELLAMTKEERKAEMKRRRETGGLEAERALSERDVQELQKKLEAMEEEGRVLSRVETRYMVEVQHEENLQLSRGEALYAILMFEQPTYTERLIMQGYTFEVIEGLREYVGEGMLQFGYGLRELFAKQGDRIAAVYENAFGVPFPREENYFAARWVVNGMKENPAEQLLAGMAGTAGAGNGWMKQRVNHNLELDMTKDALQVFLQATSLTDTWMATQDIVADFKAWTRDADFERALTAVLGKESYDNLKDWIRILEMGGVQDCLNMGVSQDVINGLYGSGAVAILGLRIQTLLKQTPSIFNGLLGAHDISAAEWFTTMSRMKNGDAPMTYKRMVNSTLIKMRQQGKAGNMAGQAMRSGDTASSAAEGLLMASMLPMEWMEARCMAIGLVPVWNVYYQRAVDQGASAQEAERAAWEQTALVANLASQPIGWLNKSKIAQNRNPIVKSAFYMLSENTAKFALCRALWRGGKKMAAFRAWLVYGAANAAISAMLDALQGDPEEFEKGKWWEYTLSAFYGPASSIPGVGEALEAAVNALLNLTGEVADIDWMKKVKTRASAGRALIDIQGSWKAMKRIYGFMTDNKEHSLAEYTRAAGTVSRTLAIGTGWMGNMVGYWSTAVAVLMNPIDFGARVWSNMRHYWD